MRANDIRLRADAAASRVSVQCAFFEATKPTFSRKMNVASQASTAAVLDGLDLATAQAALLRRRLVVEAALMVGVTKAGHDVVARICR
jgi:hypothetical protein